MLLLSFAKAGLTRGMPHSRCLAEDSMDHGVLHVTREAFKSCDQPVALGGAAQAGEDVSVAVPVVQGVVDGDRVAGREVYERHLLVVLITAVGYQVNEP